MKLRVDASRCGSSGYCGRIAPGIFVINDDGVAQVVRQPETAADETAAREACTVCPARAITFDD